eukprot:10706480-Lingulodinium_polyedra.AAC.1
MWQSGLDSIGAVCKAATEAGQAEPSRGLDLAEWSCSTAALALLLGKWCCSFKGGAAERCQLILAGWLDA